MIIMYKHTIASSKFKAFIKKINQFVTVSPCITCMQCIAGGGDCSMHWEDIISASGDIISTLGYIMICEGFFDQYIGGVPQQ